MAKMIMVVVFTSMGKMIAAMLMLLKMMMNEAVNLSRCQT